MFVFLVSLQDKTLVECMSLDNALVLVLNKQMLWRQGTRLLVIVKGPLVYGIVHAQ